MRLLGLGLALQITGCSTTPWVKPYERANLSDPVMSFNRDPVSTTYLHHVYEAREGTRGAGIASGGGCGCN
ncbi:MAG: DUF4266 domain-containing protein [Gammaproteobacteria bacterium]|nr:DUF4266 domain-containing protein [Gammaproteobacteria bacterium]